MHILISGDEAQYEPCCRVMEDMMVEDDVGFNPETEEVFMITGQQQGIGLTFCPHCGERIRVEHDISWEDKMRGVIREEMTRMMDEQGYRQFGSTHNFGEKRN